MSDDQPTKPHDVAMAESEAWRIGIVVARDMKRTYLQKRHNLLTMGWPSGHALCEELDKGAEKWAGIEHQMREDYMQHAQENRIQP